MSASNDVTGDKIYSCPTSKAYKDNFDDIFKIEKRDGLCWPKHDKHSYAAIFKELFKVDLMDKYVKKKDVVIQAGGNCGVFAKEFAKTWKDVFTFEPNDLNFTCLDKNCTEGNIHKYHAALGKNNDFVEVGQSASYMTNNCGGFQVIGKGSVPTIRIDDLNLAPDLIFLDVEGYELQALMGGFETIKKYKPVIVVENKQVPLMYGITPEEVIEYLVCQGYKVVERVQRDVVLVCE